MNYMFRILGCLAMTGLFWSCDAPSQEKVAPVLAGPLELDPTERLQFDGWWSNGSELLYLGEDSAYTLWSGSNRYHRPRETGRWNHQSYFELWLEPYEVRRPLRKRVEVRKINGVPALALESRGPMFRISRPPICPEDSLIGMWSADHAELWLAPTMSYELQLVRDETAPVSLTRHRGRWQLNDSRLILEPDTPVVPLLHLNVETQADEIVISTDDGFVFRRRVM